MRPDIKRLQTFVAIAEQGSFRGAADRLNQPQPWISVQLKDLEAMLGVLLFERSKGKMGKLTAHGEALLPAARQFLDSCDMMTRELRSIRDDNRKRIVLGVEPISLYIPRRNILMNRFLSVSGIELEIVSRTPGELFAGLDSGEFDLILTCLPVPDPGIEVLEIHAARLDLAFPKGSSGARDGASLHGARLLTMPEAFHPANHIWVKEALADKNIDWVICPEMTFEALIHYAVTLEIGTLTPDFSKSIPALSTALELRELSDPTLILRWALMRRRDHPKAWVQRLWKIAAELPAADKASAI